MKYLQYRQRIMIETLLKVKTPIMEIASTVGVCYSTVYKEIKRGAVILLDSELRNYVSYSADVAQQKSNYAQTSKGRPLMLGNDYALADFLQRKIRKEHFSPASALAAARASGFASVPSVNTLYSYIYGGVLNLSAKDLLRKGKQRPKVTDPLLSHKVAAAPGIDDRPKFINSREEVGHWEMDCVCGTQGTLPALLVLTERASRFELIRKIPDKTAASVVAALGKLRSRYVMGSITVDNGSEFRDYYGMKAAAGCEIYYCHPYRSGERGSNENANSIIRRWVPKGTSMDSYSDEYIAMVQDWMNNYPRRILGYGCAAEFEPYLRI